MLCNISPRIRLFFFRLHNTGSQYHIEDRGGVGPKSRWPRLSDKELLPRQKIQWAFLPPTYHLFIYRGLNHCLSVSLHISWVCEKLCEPACGSIRVWNVSHALPHAVPPLWMRCGKCCTTTTTALLYLVVVVVATFSHLDNIYFLAKNEVSLSSLGFYSITQWYHIRIIVEDAGFNSGTSSSGSSNWKLIGTGKKLTIRLRYIGL